MKDSILGLARYPDTIEVLLGVNEDDPTIDDYTKADMVRLYEPSGGAAQIWNDLARWATGSLLFGASDDIRFETQDWDELVWGVYENSWLDRICTLFGNDGSCGARHATHSFVSRPWYYLVGKMVPLCVRHYEGDTFTTAIGHETGRMIYIPSLVTRHLHVKYGLSPQDEVWSGLRPVQVADHERWLTQGVQEKDAAVLRLKDAIGEN